MHTNTANTHIPGNCNQKHHSQLRDNSTHHCDVTSGSGKWISLRKVCVRQCVHTDAVKSLKAHEHGKHSHLRQTAIENIFQINTAMNTPLRRHEWQRQRHQPAKSVCEAMRAHRCCEVPQSTRTRQTLTSPAKCNRNSNSNQHNNTRTMATSGAAVALACEKGV